MSCCGKARAEAIAGMQAAKLKAPVRRTIEFEYAKPAVRPAAARVTVNGGNNTALRKLR